MANRDDVDKIIVGEPDLVVADVIDGVVDGQDDVLASGQQVPVVHDVDEV